MSGEVARFRVYLPRSATSAGRRRKREPRFWEVRVYDTRKSLRAFITSSALPGGAYTQGGRAAGFCRALQVLQRRGGWAPEPRGRRGLACFALDFIGAGIVSHEWTHAAHYELTTHLGKRSVHLRDHEKLAWMQGEFVRRFWNAFYRRFKLRGREWVPA